MRGRFFLILMRWLIGVVYIISGVEKLLQPYENFLYIIQEYDILPIAALEYAAARMFPWLEYFLGGFLILGLWTRESLMSVGVFSVIFIIAIGQAMIRNLPLAECGCFGDLVGMPLAATLMIDFFILSLVIVLLKFYDRGTSLWTMDRFWKERKPYEPKEEKSES